MRMTLIVVLVTVFTETAISQVSIPSDEDSRVEFKIKNFGVVVDGAFTGLQGTIHFDPATPPTAAFHVTLEANTIDTGIGVRDNHLRKKAYFDVSRYPLIRFVSTKVTASSSHGEYILTGKLTIKETTREISFPFIYSRTESADLFKGQFRVNRLDFGVGDRSLTMADDLVVSLNIMARRIL
jgi:polyisoprenoid-binding protein YceI